MKSGKLLIYSSLIFGFLGCGLMLFPGYRFSTVLCFGFALLFLVFYLLGKCSAKAAKTARTVLLILLILGLLAAAVTGGFILSAAHPQGDTDCAYIVVLGAGVNGTVPSLSLRERINGAYDYLAAHPGTTAVLSGGQGPREEITEAACMFRELTKMGIDPDRLLLEERSTSTIENLQFSIDVIQEATGKRPTAIGIVSSEYHLYRASLFARELGLDATGIPAHTTWFSLRLNYYLREIAAVWKYLVLGP